MSKFGVRCKRKQYSQTQPVYLQQKRFSSKQWYGVLSTFLDLDADQVEPAEPVVLLFASGEPVAQVEHSRIAQAVPVVSRTADLEEPGQTLAEIDQEKSAGILRFGSCWTKLEFICSGRQANE